ncbi:ketol-acid reductoisomerase [bacterium SM23_31]|nr:MAG: ketol-acid reductoisomerase [bacterium SM23_31]
MKFYYDDDADLELLHDKVIGIIGYGNQGRAHALNLRDSGLHVVVGLREGSPNRSKAENEGLTVDKIERTAESADFIVLLIPDELQPEVYRKSIEPHLTGGKILGFAHGFNIHFGGIKPPDFVDAVINSPKCIGYLVRENYRKGYGFPNLIAVHQDVSGKARDYALAYAKGIGGTRAGVMESTVEEETVTNLFGEQSVLCGGIVELIKAGFETLVQAGYQPEIAFFECMHEIKPIIDLFYKEGLAEMNRRISNTAEFGEYISGPRVIGEQTRTAMKSVLRDIQDGAFAKRWMEEHRSGEKIFESLRKVSATHPIEKVGAQMRKKMPWLKEDL